MVVLTYLNIYLSFIIILFLTITSIFPENKCINYSCCNDKTQINESTDEPEEKTSLLDGSSQTQQHRTSTVQISQRQLFKHGISSSSSRRLAIVNIKS